MKKYIIIEILKKSLKFFRNCLQKEYLEFDVLLTLSV